MYILFDDKDSLRDVQDKFHVNFPTLKLEFTFSGKENPKISNPSTQPFNCIPLQQLCKPGIEGALTIEEGMTLKELETSFRVRYGIKVTVFVKEGHYWTRNSHHDNLPLQHWISTGGSPVFLNSAPLFSLP